MSYIIGKDKILKALKKMQCMKQDITNLMIGIYTES